MTAATECGFEILPRLTYSRDMAPSDFYLFPKLKRHLQGTQYVTNEGVIKAANEYLGGGGASKKARTEMVEVRCLEGRSYFKVLVKVSFPDSLKYKGPRSF